MLGDIIKQPVRIDTDRVAKLQKFYDIEAPLAEFNFGYEGLRSAKLPSKVVLSDSGFLSRLDQEGQHAVVSR